MTTSVARGAPGLFFQPESAAPRVSPARMDVCAFVGVAPRGPARVPRRDESRGFYRSCVEPALGRRRSVAVPVESFAEYRRLFGGFEGPGLLPYAVATFFDQGGHRAYVVRIVHDHGDPAQDAKGVAVGLLSGSSASSSAIRLVAKNEGTWGNRLRAALGFTTAPLGRWRIDALSLTRAGGELPAVGSLLRLTLDDGSRLLRFARDLGKRGRETSPGSYSTIRVDRAAAGGPEDVDVEVVEGLLWIDDGDGRVERHEALGLSPSHPRWMGMVLCDESELVDPDPSWVEEEILPDGDPALLGSAPPTLPDPSPPQFAGGEDRYSEITPDDHFDPAWTLGDPDPGNGVLALVDLPDLASVVIPDLYATEPLPEFEPVLGEPSLAGPHFSTCVDNPPAPGDQARPAAELSGLHLDPRLPADLDEIIRLQSQLVELAESLGRFVALLDVPPGLTPRQLLLWRSRLDSSYAAAYHPWLPVSRTDDNRDALVSVNPAAAAAGIIARQESLFGVPHGPANAIAVGVVDVADRVSPARHDEIHPLGINVFLRDRDGIRLTAGRTLARDRPYRQLSVRRLMIMLRRVLAQQAQWVVFEPNGPALWADVRQMLRAFLRRLYLWGAFRGATEDEAYFVRCDESLNPPYVRDAGRLVVEVGVAPAEPLEFLVLRITRTDGDIRAEEL